MRWGLAWRDFAHAVKPQRWTASAKAPERPWTLRGCRYAFAHPTNKRPYLFSRLTVISGTSVPGVTIDTDWWLPRVVRVMLDVTPGACATAWT